MRLAKRFYHPVPLLAAVCLVGMTGCATNEALDHQMSTSREAVDQAQIAGAEHTAPEDYGNAVSKLNRAKAAAEHRSDQDEAMRLAQQAQADANLAHAKTDSLQAKTAAAELAKSNLLLRESIRRNQNQ
jgi:hypothetical protein